MKNLPIFVHSPVRTEAARAARAVRSLPAARYMLAVLGLGALYASLRPFSGWRVPPRGWLAFLTDPVAFTIKSDILLNIIGYVPLGMLAVLALASERRRLPVAAAWAVGGCLAFSVGVEILQSALPTRTPSLVDVITNAAGATIGALAGCLYAPWLLTEGGFLGFRRRHLLSGWRGDLGLALLAGWAVALLAPRTLLFGNGDARRALGVQAVEGLSQEVFIGVEAAVTTAGLLTFALLLRLMLTTDGWRLRVIFLSLLVASLGVRTAGFTLFWSSVNAFQWVTAGAVIGLGLGLALAIPLLGLARRQASVLVALLLLATTLSVNLAPPNPYIWAKPRPSRQSELAPLSLTTRTTAMLWPAGALAFTLAVMTLPRRRKATEVA